MAQFMLALLLATIQLPLDSTDEIHFNEEAKSWIDALEHCNKNGSSLVEITNTTTWDTVNSDLANETNKMEHGAWIGLERSIFANNEISLEVGFEWNIKSHSRSEGRLSYRRI
ncbi:hypothetical protein E3U43_011330 [Larimichthys crocea]|uniref:Uncharacterized protein n=1 Tax=Larimichthys crocea TaxID=215358 RepID=A0ACD3QJ07_LARCR|nr:hypothetical protein E3U43_011330 [Larimichthys crocea]